MSSIETVKIIVEAEKEAAKILDDAQSKAAAIRKQLALQVQQQREEIMQGATKSAAEIIQRADQEGKAEAENYEKTSEPGVRELASKASSMKSAAVARLVEMVLEAKA